jgi:hypothetical protein
MSETTRVEDYVNVPANLADVLRIVARYWRFDATEQSELAARRIESLPWSDLLRLHHLNCMEAFRAEHIRRQLELDEAPNRDRREPNEALERCRPTGNRLLSTESPYRPRRAALWQRSPNAQGQQQAEPTARGELTNPALTHFGCLEVLRLDEQKRPHALAFVPFRELRGVSMSTPRYFRLARLAFADGRPDENVYLPVLYAMTWRSPTEFLREGRMTAFLEYPTGSDPASKYGLGVGQQNFALDKNAGGMMFGHSAVAQIAFA